MVAGQQAQVATGGTAVARPLAKPIARAVPGLRYLRLALLVAAGALLVWSIFLPYWNIVLHAPQYPKGLSVDVFVYKMEPLKNVHEVDNLNHYIGMIRLTDAATLEQDISRIGIPFLALLAIASFWLRGPWRLLARLPIVLYPAIFVADLFAWLYYAGHSLDPHAPLSSSIKEFTPRLIGDGRIGQFSTEAAFQSGFYAALAAAGLVLLVTVLDRRADHAKG